MSEYQELKISLPEEINKIADLLSSLNANLDLLIKVSKLKMASAKLQASGANIEMMGLKVALDKIISELEKLKAGGTFSGIIAHPSAHRIKAGYDRVTDTMTLTPISALKQIKDAFDDEGDPLAPDKVNNYGGFVIVGSAPGVEEYVEIGRALGKFFSIQELKDLADQIEERWEEKKAEAKGEEKVVAKLSTGLDFEGYSQGELFPGYIDLLNEIQGYVEEIKSGIISASSSLDDAMAFLDKKLAKGISIIKKTKEFIGKFSLPISSGFIHYKVFKLEEHTAKTIKEELLKGTPKMWGTSDYSIVFGLFAGSKSVELIFELLSLD